MAVHQASVIVVGYNGDRWLPTCVNSLRYASESRIHLILVDNLNNPCIQTLDLSPFSVDLISTPRTMGFAEANNFALNQCRSSLAELTVFLNQDTVSSPGWIDMISSAFAAHQSIGVVSPGLRIYDMSEWEPNLLNCLMDSGIAATELESDRELIVGLVHVTAAAMAVRTESLNVAGPFDPVFGSYYEDFDLCRRIRRTGKGIGVCSRAKVGHFQGSASLDPTTRRNRERAIIRNRLLHALRDCDGHRLRTLVPYVIATLPRNLARGVWGTPSSQSVSSTILAHLDLLKMANRVVSEQSDQRAWQLFLDGIEWHRDEANEL